MIVSYLHLSCTLSTEVWSRSFIFNMVEFLIKEIPFAICALHMFGLMN